MEHTITYTGICIRGLVRKKNEDNLWCGGRCLPLDHPEEEYYFEGTVDADNSRFAVFDGVGGETCGEAASYEAACAFGGQPAENAPALSIGDESEDSAQSLCIGDESEDSAQSLCIGDESENSAQSLCIRMNSRVLAYAESHQAYGMGTTVVGICFGTENIQGFNVGDSRCYVLSDGKLTQLSTDHTRRSFITGKSLLTQCIGVPETEFIPEPDVFSAEYKKGDLFLLCSDGLWGILGDSLIEEILNAETSLKERAEKMKEEVLSRGAGDNMTLLLFEIL